MTPDQASQAVKKAFDLIEPMLKEQGLEIILITSVPNSVIGVATTAMTYDLIMSIMQQAVFNIHEQFTEAAQAAENN